MFKIQEEDGKKLEKVWCLAFSSKRYAVYQYQNDTITILKYSNHALGHYLTIDPKEFWHDMILLWYHPEKKEIVSKYKTKYAISELSITHYSFLKSFDGVNSEKRYSQRIRPYDIVLVGTACRKDSTGMPIVPFVPRFDNNLDEIPFMPFVDKSGRQYPNSDSLDSVEYWKKMSLVFSEYRDHRETKLDNLDGIVQRKHIVFGKESIRYAGKEIHDLEESIVFGASKNDSIAYENEQDRLRRIINNLTLKRALELCIPRRTYFDWKKKIKENKQIILKNKLDHLLL